MSFSSSISKHMTPKMLMTVGAPIAAVIAVAGIAMGSNAAFVSTTDTEVNRWTSGAVQLDNDHDTIAAFSADGIVPGYTESHCVVVTSSSTVATDVKMYAWSPNAGLLSYDLLFDIQAGTGGTNVAGVDGAPGSCTGFTPDAVDSTVFNGTAYAFMNNHATSATGAGTVTLAAGESKTYMVTATLPDDSTREGETTSTRFAWSATNK